MVCGRSATISLRSNLCCNDRKACPWARVRVQEALPARPTEGKRKLYAAKPGELQRTLLIVKLQACSKALKKPMPLRLCTSEIIGNGGTSHL